jgi:hypothetical protein
MGGARPAPDGYHRLMEDEIGPDAGALFWDLVEGRARLAALEEIEGAFGTAGHSDEIMERVRRRKAQVSKTIEQLVAEAHAHHQRR